MPHTGFEEIEHTADWALRVWGPDLPALCRAAAQGMYALMHTDLAAGPRRQHTFTLAAAEPEDTLIDFLSELLFRLEVDGLAFDHFDFTPQAGGWQVILQGAPVLRIGKEIKAVTYHNLEVRPTPHGLEAVLVFDV